MSWADLAIQKLARGERATIYPSGSTCEADDGRGSDFGRCGDPAAGYAILPGGDREPGVDDKQE